MNTQTQYLVNRYKTKKKKCVHLNSCHTKRKKIFQVYKLVIQCVMKIKANIFNLQCWIYMESTYELSKAALFLWWIIGTDVDFSRASQDQNSFPLNNSVGSKPYKFKPENRKRGISAGRLDSEMPLHHFVFPLRVVMRGLQPDFLLDWIYHSKAYYTTTHIQLWCVTVEKSCWHTCQHSSLRRTTSGSCGRPKLWGLCWTSCTSYLHVHSGCLCMSWK